MEALRMKKELNSKLKSNDYKWLMDYLKEQTHKSYKTNKRGFDPDKDEWGDQLEEN
jgi:hypothetical protein